MEVIFDKPRKDLTGHRNNMLTVLHTYRQDGVTYVACLCDCGLRKTLRAQVFQRPTTKSCGCLTAASGEVNTPTYYTWAGMKARCLNPNHTAYANYGGRGVKVCNRWNSFENFLADMGHRPDGMELDRVDPNGDYAPGNCRWVTRIENIQNRRNTRTLTIDGDTRTWVEWAAFADITRGALKQRLKRGWTPAQAVGIDERT